MACDTYGWISFAQLNEMYFCNYCKHMHARTISRARCNVQLSDNTGTITASLFGDVAENFLKLPAEKLMKDSITLEHFINAQDSSYAIEDHFIYMKFGNPNSKTNQPRFDVIYVLNNSSAHAQRSASLFPYQAKEKNVSYCTNVPNARRSLVFEKENIEQLKK
ncbi:uncharacterized protein LOC111385433 [Olea europaea var. sylvestris]|uniref:uncharacterized protein LOC111385433 n=1 Tax=Olea europaea var. sylvestris TaxID=158386 RepID=UPI000C1D7B53|nr:uncharacterized protein LOC111385433 [Olea europaea var. sylvestris]